MRAPVSRALKSLLVKNYHSVIKYAIICSFPDPVLNAFKVRHQVAVPKNYDYTPISSHVPASPPARSYPFTLDPFQQVSIYAIERNESVLVSAHTSAGKTVVAEYAIARCLRDKQRVIYTSPIKVKSQWNKVVFH